MASSQSLAVFFIFIFLAVVSNAWQGVIYSASQLGSADHHGEEGTEAGAGGSWSHCICSQEAGSEECWLSSLSPFHSSQIPSACKGATYIRGRNELIQSKKFLRGCLLGDCGSG